MKYVKDTLFKFTHNISFNVSLFLYYTGIRVESQVKKIGDIKPPILINLYYLIKPFAIALYPAPTTDLGALPVL